MTGRRRSGRKAGSTSKKDTPEKSRRSSRRRGHKKSDSEPEVDDSVSEQSFEERDRNDVDDDPLSLGKKEGALHDGNSKEDESGGSDGAWQVRSENGNKGGIPKLKICLQRPADMASPTSETLPSPRTRRSRRGATESPSKPENNEEGIIEEANTSTEGDTERRSSRLRKQMEKKDDDVREPAVKETSHEPVSEELKKQKDTKRQQEAANALKEKHLQEEAEKESQRKREREAAADVKRRAQEEKQRTLEKEKLAASEKREKVEAERKQRSPSRDSSEERAKEAALRSRKTTQSEGKSDVLIPSFPARNGGRIRTTGLDDSSHKENSQEVVRKRRWGSSSGNSSKTHPVAISTDILKEIIPEAKLVPLNEVELSPNRDEDVFEQKDELEERRAPVAKRRRSIPSDESEKDYEEEGVESGGEEMIKKRTPIDTNHVSEAPKRSPPHEVRKVIVTEASLNDLKQRSPSPAKNPVSNILYITNLVRPYTVAQLRDLLARTGNIVSERGFWIDPIKSQCYVEYTSAEEAKTTRHALHGIQWPTSNPKQLTVEFGTAEAMELAIKGNRPRSPKRIVTEERKERDRPRPDDEKKYVSDSRSRAVVDNEKPSRTVRKVTAPVREWDLGKTERGISPPLHEVKPFEDERRRRERDRNRRSTSDEPHRKIKRKEEKKVSLNDLFRKTKATPCIYWLPLTSPQKALKEEMRRKHMEEHEKQLAEQRKRREAKPNLKQRSRSRSPKK